MDPIPASSLETIWDDGEFTLSRAVPNSALPRVFITVPSLAHPSSSSLARLENAFALRDELHESWAACPRALVRDHGRLALLAEDPGGELLQRLVGKPMEIGAFLDIATGIANALARCHEHGIIHKDIKPANICVNLSTGGAWLMGFGMASRMPRERRLPDLPTVIAGTLAYMAPEQTGRMNRSVDSRSDLYSLGVTFYEMLTGALPFTASNPMEWIHSHIARQPVPPAARLREIPGQLSHIVVKLLAKSAEDRYQTAAGLEADLRRCLDQWGSQGNISEFPPGADDRSDRLLIPERLYGREQEVQSLFDAFDGTRADGGPELVLVSGYSGIGKSSVASELRRILVPSRGLFAAAKFDAFRQEMPYATLAQAFRPLMRDILAGSESEMVQWRRALQESVGEDGRLIAALIPELEAVIGEQPPVAPLSPKAARNRFHMVFRRFLGVFAQPERPLALVLDDLQWLDPASLELLEYLVIEQAVPHLLLVGSYRDNETGPSHPLTLTLDAARASRTRVREIDLLPLQPADVEQFVADSLRADCGEIGPLAELVYEKTGGNPFFVIQFLTALADEGALAFNRENAAWQWDTDIIRRRSSTDNVGDMMAGRLNRLSPATQNALQRFAAFANVATSGRLSIVLELSEEDVGTVLREALHAGLILFQDGTYTFLHDRVREAAYAPASESERSAMHLAIGRALVSQASPEEIEENIFEIANQFNRSGALVDSREERDRIARLNLSAGNRAQNSAAWESALEYYAAGSEILGDEGWEPPSGLKFSIEHRRAMIEIEHNRFDAAEMRHAAMIQRCESTAERMAVHMSMLHLHFARSEYSRALGIACECLRLQGIEVIEPLSREQLERAYEDIMRRLDGRTIESLVDLPPATDPQIIATIDVLAMTFPPAYHLHQEAAYLYICHMVTLTLDHGVAASSNYGLGYFGSMLCQVFGRCMDGYRFVRLALEVTERHNLALNRAVIHYLLELVEIWTHPLSQAIESLRSAFAIGVETGTITIACYSRFGIVSDMLVRGDRLDAVLAEAEQSLAFAQQAGSREVIDAIVNQKRFIQTLRGVTPSIETFNDGEFDEAAFEASFDDSPLAFSYWISKGAERFMAGHFEDAVQALERAGTLQSLLDSRIQHFEYVFFLALTIAALHPTDNLNTTTHRRRLDALCDQLGRWAQTCPSTFADKHALISGEIARIDGRDVEAMHLYDEAIRMAQEQGFLQYEGVAGEVAARFYTARGFDTIALTYLQNARYCYLRWGALGKVRHLEQHHPELRTGTAPAAAGSTIDAATSQLDVATVVRASQALSGEIVLDRLIEKLMVIAVEHAGAERGLLILPRDDRHLIEAEATTGTDTVEVRLRPSAVTSADLPESVMQLAIRTGESVMLDDASAESLFAADEYVRRHHARSILCLPLVKQAALMGVLYLENNLAPYVFTPDRVALLQLLASQAAISLENAHLYGDIRELKDQLYHENIALREEVDKTSMFEEIIGTSAPLRAVLARVARVAPTDSTVLITGETGTGKELVARAIHKRSQRADRAFVSVNCAAIPQALIASELFGHEKGAFTGALQRRLGRFELAEGGTIFLDEIGELPAETQIALLRVLQEREFERVGGVRTMTANVRVIAATHRNLQAQIASGAFRSDLFYRLNVFPIEVPPLRDRRDDIRLLVEYFIDRYASKAGKRIRSVSKNSFELLQSYQWPGNIRELQNVIERSVILCDGENFAIDESWLSCESVSAAAPVSMITAGRHRQEKEMIESALAECMGKVAGPSGAAARLGIPPSTLESKIKALKINKHRYKN